MVCQRWGSSSIGWPVLPPLKTLLGQIIIHLLSNYSVPDTMQTTLCTAQQTSEVATIIILQMEKPTPREFKYVFVVVELICASAGS